jgi:phage terminase large subunit-like protein
MSARLRRRFRDGEFGDATPGALFTEEDIEKWRVIDGVVPELVRVVVAVDPSGSGDEDNADNDEIGIAVVGLGTRRQRLRAGGLQREGRPRDLGPDRTSAYDRHAADIVVGEANYGGAMVGHVIQTARPRTPFKLVTATRGKAVRAEPFSALYENGKVRHAGRFPSWRPS